MVGVAYLVVDDTTSNISSNAIRTSNSNSNLTSYDETSPAASNASNNNNPLRNSSINDSSG